MKRARTDVVFIPRAAAMLLAVSECERSIANSGVDTPQQGLAAGVSSSQAHDALLSSVPSKIDIGHLMSDEDLSECFG